jgi:hypothetical protein
VISVLVPSRGRPAQLARSIASLGDGDLEVLVRIDDDDPCRDEYLALPYISVTVGPRHGYAQLHRYYNELAERAAGEWLLIWNDDSIMETRDWIDIVSSYDGKMVVLNPTTNHANWDIDMNVFPIFPRRMVELMGHISLSPHNDSWIEFVARDAGIMIRSPIVILHDRADLTGNNDDQTYADRELATGEFHSEAMARKRERDVRAIVAHLAAHPEARLEHGGVA